MPWAAMTVLKHPLTLALLGWLGLASANSAVGQISTDQAFDKDATAQRWWELYFKDSRSVALPDGRTLNLLCEGEGAPVVILDAGMGSGAWAWRYVHAELARTTRVCAYDRSGYGQSSRSLGARNAGAEADELAQLLERASLPVPYIVVGASYAAYVDRLYVSRHTSQVAALILIDPSSEYQFTRFAAVNPVAASNDAYALSIARACLESAKAGALDHGCLSQAPDDLPASRADWWRQQASALAEASLGEFVAMNTASSDQLAAERHSLGALPLLILHRGNPEAAPGLSDEQAKAMSGVWRLMHEETLRLSANAELRVVAGAGHQMQQDRPMAVVDAIDGVVDRVRAGIQEK
jgi:pimeloyl-ACP methyl ester carboxylesterase